MKTKIIYSLPQYGLGSWLQDNAGTIGTAAGAGLGLLVGNPMLGAQIGGTIGNGVFNRHSQKALELEQNRKNDIDSAMINYNAMPNPMYGANFANGGILNSLACGGKLMSCGGKMKANGGMLEATKKLDNITYYGNGGTHEQSPVGGIRIGNKGRTEQGEVRYGDYIFSNRF